MTQADKLLKKLLSVPVPSDFTWPELLRLLKRLGYEPIKRSGKTGGGKRCFRNKRTGHKINTHKPHSGNRLKKYVVNDVKKALKDQGIID